MKYYIIAGEASGDLHGANLIKALRAEDHEAEFRFWGGDKMSVEAGSEPVMHYRETSIMGHIAVLLNIRKIKGFFRLCKQDITHWQPDVIIFVDYPGFNLRMAKWAKTEGRNYRTHYYILPKVWAWRGKRVKDIREYVDRCFGIFPFEEGWFAAKEVKVDYVGNPLLDEVQGGKESGVVLPKTKTIALVAGSRAMEVKHNLPEMIKTLSDFEGYTGVVTAVDWLPRELYERVIKGAHNIRVEYGKTYQVMQLAEGAIVTSGTATLEAALWGVPQVVCYRGPWLSMLIAKILLTGRIRWVSLVNIIMNRGVVVELLGNRAFSAENARVELQKILPEGAGNQKMMEDYRELREVMGGTGASGRCAKLIVEDLQRGRGV